MIARMICSHCVKMGKYNHKENRVLTQNPTNQTATIFYIFIYFLPIKSNCMYSFISYFLYFIF